jgi:hypothetical protein
MKTRYTPRGRPGTSEVVGATSHAGTSGGAARIADALRRQENWRVMEVTGQGRRHLADRLGVFGIGSTLARRCPDISRRIRQCRT